MGLDMTFEEKVRSMSAAEIIMAMVNGLRKRHVNVRMSSFGSIWDGVCYGCAATNTICEISGKVFTDSLIVYGRSYFVGAKSSDFLGIFEVAIDWLRSGEIWEYNRLAEHIKISLIEDVGIELPYLTDNYTDHQLDKYVELAIFQP